MEEENVEIISCEAAEAIKRFREGDIDQIGDVTGRQLTGLYKCGLRGFKSDLESVETARKMMDKLTDTGASQSVDVEMVAQEASKPDTSYRIYSNAEATISQLQQRISRLEELGKAQIGTNARAWAKLARRIRRIHSVKRPVRPGPALYPASINIIPFQ